MPVKTNAARLLDRLGIEYEIREYPVDPEDLSAETVAAKVGMPPGQTFKTLVARGDRSEALIQESPADLKLVALADCDRRAIADRLSKFRNFQGSVVAEKCSPYQDYRRMLSEEKLDGVFVATPTHARVLICIHAMQAGLDVYAEKPLTLTIEEGQILARAERKYRTVFQVGTQQRSIAAA